MRTATALAAALLVSSCALSDHDGPEPLADVAYRKDGKLPMVQVRVNGAGPYWFIVDSGASRTVLDASLARELGLRPTAQGSTTGTGQGSVALSYVGKTEVSIAELTYSAEPYVIDLSRAPLSKEVRGLVGSEIFKTHVVQLAPARQRLAIYAPDRPPALTAGAELPMSVDGGKLFLPATLDVREGHSVRRQLRIDTGSESSVNDPSAAEAELTAATTLGGA